MFVSVLYPLHDPSQAAAVASSIAVKVNTTDGSMLVSLPGVEAPVSVPWLDVAPTGGLLVWLSAQSLSNASWGRPLLSWPDSRVSYNSTFTPLNASALATVNATAMNGYPAVRFSGSQALVGPSVFPQYGDYTVTALLLVPSVISGGQVVLGSTVAAQHVLALTSGRFEAFHNTLTLPSSTAQVKANQPLLVTQVWQQSLGTLSLYLNGTLIASSSTAPSTTVADSSLLLAATNSSSAAFQYLRGFLSELLIFDYALPTSNRTALEHFILVRYGLAEAGAGALQTPFEDIILASTQSDSMKRAPTALSG